MLINTENTARVWEHDFKALHPNTLFPDQLTNAVVSDFGHAVLNYPAQPAPALGQKVIDNGQALIDGYWQVQWAVIDLTPGELASIARDVRSERDQLLADCDWTQVADAPVDASLWATYRQALRDVPTQTGFPLTVEWPIAPGA